MHPKPFAYHRGDSLESALAVLAQFGGDAAPYAGGTELLLIMKMRLAEYGHLVDLKSIKGLKGITTNDPGLTIGATTTHRMISGDPDVRGIAPALAKLCGEIANPRVRSVGTIGGNLCFAEPNADPPILLAAYGASLQLTGPGSTRVVPAAGFITGPLETIRAPDEVLTRIDIPSSRASLRYARHMNGHRSLVCAAAFVPPDHGAASRVWLGGVLHRPVALPATEAIIDGFEGKIDKSALETALHKEMDVFEIADDVDASADYRRHIACVLAMRAITDAAEN
jgi:carbon-monoxide dehydrogenase medium subunit